MCAAHLHSPLTVVMICMILAKERLMKDDEVRDMFVYPLSKKICMNYGKASKQKWIESFEEQTYGKDQNLGRVKQHTPLAHIPPRPITLILEVKPTLTKEEVSQLW